MYIKRTCCLSASLTIPRLLLILRARAPRLATTDPANGVEDCHINATINMLAALDVALSQLASASPDMFALPHCRPLLHKP